MKKRPTIFTVLILTLFAMPSVGLMTSPANNMPIAAAVDYDSASGSSGGTTEQLEEGKPTPQPQPAPQTKEPQSKPAEETKKNKKTEGAPCTATVSGHGTYQAGKCVITSCDDTKNYVVNEEQTHCILGTTQKIKDNIDAKKTKRQNKKDQTETEKAKCDKATDAKWIAGKCTCNDKTMEWTDTACKKKSGDCKDSYFGTGKYNGDGICIIDKCSDQYVVNKDKNKCELETTANIRDKKAEKETKKLDKEYTSDIKTLIDAYNTKVKELTQECVTKGKTITDGECADAN